MGKMIVRQGDVGLRVVDRVPAGAQPVGRTERGIVLAYGEVTGHAHAIRDLSATMWRAKDGREYLLVEDGVAVLEHEEHGAVTLARHASRITSDARLSQRGRIKPVWGWVPIAALVLFFVAIGLQPVQAEEEPVLAWELAVAFTILGTVVLGWIAGAVAIFKGLRLGLWLSLPSTLTMLLFVVSCPASGHHTWGPWVIGSFGSAFGATALHVGSLLATRKWVDHGTTALSKQRSAAR